MIWLLPEKTEINGKSYAFHTDFREVLKIIGFLNGELPEFIRWQVALRLFYKEPVAEEDEMAALKYLAWFLAGGETPEGQPGPRLLDWEQDASAIVSDINRVAGCEIRALSHVHWWTFLSWFHAIGEGQLSLLVTIRDKRRRGEKLTKAEQEFYRQNKARVELKKAYSAEELAQQARLKKLLGE